MEFSDEEQLATVTIVEDFDPVDPTSNSHLTAQFASDEEQQPRDQRRGPITPTQFKAIAREIKFSKPKFAYETKAARKYEKNKQAARRNEKARAKGRQKGKK
jgi:ribosomal RNA-processing protein 17